jgi:hypothetical protein
MTLRSGCRLVVAPLFHLPVDWGRRLQLGSFPHSDWRSPDAAELALLLPDESQPMPRENLTDCLCLFQLPRHLLTAWWGLAAQLDASGVMPSGGFDAFALEVERFMAFKELPLPEGASLDLLVSQPGQRSVHDQAGSSELWGGINLGDEATSVVFINLPACVLMSEVERGSPNFVQPAAFDELAERFQKLYPDYSLVRLRIEPGEGYRLPAGGLLVYGCTLDKRELDILLRVRCPS